MLVKNGPLHQVFFTYHYTFEVIHIIALLFHSFLLLSNIPFMGNQVLFVLTLGGGCWEYFHFLAVLNKAAMHIYVQVCV